MKYQEWLSEWLNNYVMPSSKQRTYTRYEEIVMQHIVPHLGEYEIAELSPIIFQKFVTLLLQSGNLKNGQGLATNSVNSIITVVQCSLEMAYRVGVYDKYVADKIKRPKVTEKQIICFT